MIYLCPSYAHKIFAEMTHYKDEKRRVNSVRHGTEYISFLGPKIWDLVPSDIKLSQLLSIFKRKIKKWVPLQCPCRFFKVYLQHVGFIQ